MRVRQTERHRTKRVGWLRAAVLGANDGILSTASLMLGVAAAHATHSNVMVAGVAGLVAASGSATLPPVRLATVKASNCRRFNSPASFKRRSLVRLSQCLVPPAAAIDTTAAKQQHNNHDD
jgi:VIT family